MQILSSIPEQPRYAIPHKALQRWVKERLQCEPRAPGGMVYSFTLSGSTCTNIPIEVVMTVSVDAAGRIDATSARPLRGNAGCNLMCAADGHGLRFLATTGGCDEAIGLTLQEAAFRDWHVEPSGCFCSAGNRRHKWRNVFQALYYASTHDA